MIFICLFAGVIFDQYQWDETMNQSPNELTEWNRAEWHFRGFCDHCRHYRTLATVDGLDLCEACDLDRLVSLGEAISDNDYPPVGERV